jgi:hypothetical protein
MIKLEIINEEFSVIYVFLKVYIFVILIICPLKSVVAMINIFHRNKPADNYEQFHTANKSLYWNYTSINNTLHRFKRL